MVNRKAAVTKKYFSQFGQDKWVAEEIFNFKKNGYFLDLAAGDGIVLSNTYFLEKFLDWKGICIEASDVLFERLIKNRTCICEKACVDSKHQRVKFTNDRSIKEGPYWKNLLGRIIDKDTDNLDDAKNKDFVWKETTTLREILEKYKAPKIIDFFSLDVEGAEIRVIKDFPFNEYTFLSMSVERPSELLHTILKKNNYLYVNETRCDKLYLHKSLFKTFSIKKKLKTYYFPAAKNMVFIIKNRGAKITRIIYYIKHLLEIPNMVRRKLTKFINWLSRL